MNSGSLVDRTFAEVDSDRGVEPADEDGGAGRSFDRGQRVVAQAFDQIRCVCWPSGAVRG